jgi:hypothetical protein
MEVRFMTDDATENKISKIVNTFGLGRTQDLLTLFGELKSAGVTITQLATYMERVAEFSSGNFPLTCPDCGLAAYISEINTNSRNQVDGGYCSLVYCVDEAGCGWSRLDLKTLEQWLQDLKVPQILRAPRPEPFRILCPSCGKRAFIMPVNTNPANQVGGKYKSQLYCSDDNCGYESYSRKTPAEILRKLMRREKTHG